MLFAHHLEITFFGLHWEPEGVIEHVLALSASGLVFLLAAYGGYTLLKKLLRGTADQTVPRT